MDKSTGNHCFNYHVWGLPVGFPIISGAESSLRNKPGHNLQWFFHQPFLGIELLVVFREVKVAAYDHTTQVSHRGLRVAHVSAATLKDQLKF